MVLQSEIRDHGEGEAFFFMSRTVEEEKEKAGKRGKGETKALA